MKTLSRLAAQGTDLSPKSKPIWVDDRAAALDLAGVVRITRLINHTDGHLPSRQGVSPTMQSDYRMELVAELPQEFEKLSANAADAFSLR